MAPSTVAAEMARNKMRDGVEPLKHSIVAIGSEIDDFRAALRIIRDLRMDLSVNLSNEGRPVSHSGVHQSVSD